MELQILLPLRLYHPLNTPHLPASICVLIGTLHPRKGTYKNQLSELVCTKISTTGRSPIHAARNQPGWLTFSRQTCPAGLPPLRHLPLSACCRKEDSTHTGKVVPPPPPGNSHAAQTPPDHAWASTNAGTRCPLP